MWPWRLERIYESLAPNSVFLSRMRTSVLLALSFVAASLFLRTDLSGWIDDFHRSTMILSGMGPVSQNPNDCEKVFAGLYALYSGFVLVVVMGLILTPIFHRVLHHFLLQA